MIFLFLLMLQLILSTEDVSKQMCSLCGAEHITNKSGIFKNFSKCRHNICDPVNFNSPNTESKLIQIRSASAQTESTPAQTWSIDVFVPKPKMKLRFQTQCPNDKSKFTRNVNQELEYIAPDLDCECVEIEPAADVLKYKSWYVRNPTFFLNTFWIHLQGNGCEAVKAYISENQLTINGQKYILVKDVCEICRQSGRMNILGCSSLHMYCENCVQIVQDKLKSKCPTCREPITLYVFWKIGRKMIPVARIIFINEVLEWYYIEKIQGEFIDLLTGIYAGPAYGYFSRKRVIRYLIEFALVTEPLIMLLNYLAEVYEVDWIPMIAAYYINIGVKYSFKLEQRQVLSGAQLYFIMNHKDIGTINYTREQFPISLMMFEVFNNAIIILIIAALTASLFSGIMQRIGKLGNVSVVSLAGLIIGFLTAVWITAPHNIITYTLPYGWTTFNSAVVEKSFWVGVAVFYWHEVFRPLCSYLVGGNNLVGHDQQ